GLHGRRYAGHRQTEGPVERMEYELVHGARVPKPHFGLGRVYVDVDLSRIDVEKQHECRMALVVKNVLVGLADRMRRELVADEPAVPEEILRVAGRPGVRGQPDSAVEPQP